MYIHTKGTYKECVAKVPALKFGDIKGKPSLMYFIIEKREKVSKMGVAELERPHLGSLWGLFSF